MLRQINDPKLTEKVLVTAEAADTTKLNKIVEKLSLRMEALNA
jgi:hypothetical protein